MVTGLDAGRWNARGLVLVPRIPQAQVRREGLPPTRQRRVPIGKQRRTPRQSPAWRKLRSREGSTYIVDYFIPVWGTSVETNSPHAVKPRTVATIRVYPTVTPECYVFPVTLGSIFGFCDAAGRGLTLM